jgi:hypothetical protein
MKSAARRALRRRARVTAAAEVAAGGWQFRPGGPGVPRSHAQARAGRDKIGGGEPCTAAAAGCTDLR